MRRLAILLAYALAPTVLVAQGMADFARGAAITIDGPGSIFRVELSEDVYATVTREGLSDLRVLNGAGTAVPHTIRMAVQPLAAATEPVTVPVFALEERATTNPRTQVVVSDTGAVLEVRRASGSNTRVTSYLIDATTLRSAVDRVVLSLTMPEGASVLAKVDVERSDDLSQWQIVVAGAAVARMQQAGYTLAQSSIALPPTTARYLRIRWPEELSAVVLGAAALRPVSPVTAAPVSWRTLVGTIAAGQPRVVSYDLRSRLPVEQVDLEFVDATDAADVTVSTRALTTGQWRTVHRGVFFSLADPAATVRSDPARVARVSQRYWTVETTRESGWDPGRLPRLKLGWRPHEVLFLAQGAAPYILVYGSASVAAADTPIDAVLASLARDEQPDRAKEATLADAYDLAGPRVLQPPTEWRRIGLWALLIVAVVVLAGFAVRLLKEPAQQA